MYGGPGSGKSTMAFKLTGELKEKGYNVELVTEFAKELTWKERYLDRSNQLYVFGEQHHKLWSLKGQVDAVITDTSLLLSRVYGDTSDTFKQVVLEEHNKFNNLDIFLKRVKGYNPKGRTQTETEAKALDRDMMDVIGSLVNFDAILPGEHSSLVHILYKVEQAIHNGNLWDEG
jgi:broad-specificity NMP kinase